MKKILVLFFCTLSFATSFASGNADSNKPPQPKMVVLRGKGISVRPGAPSNFLIDCYYGEGYIGFVFPSGVNFISVSISNESEEWAGLVTVDEPETMTPSFSGEYEIECVADNGHTFVGIIEY
ncbi:MAG: hypothetical protein K2K68_10195 [Duncaniella sp.]|nr:hypothetical protein [Duncaniella sp.]